MNIQTLLCKFAVPAKKAPTLRIGARDTRIEPLESRIAPAALATLAAGSIAVQGDQGGVGEVETLTFTISGSDLHISDPTHAITAGAGFTQNGANDVFIAFSSLTVDLAVDTGTGADTVAVNSALSLPGAADFTSGTLTFNAPISVAGPAVLHSTGDANIFAQVETTGLTADLTVLADSDGDGTGGVLIGDNLLQGALKAGHNLDVRGSEYSGSAVPALGGLQDSVIVQSNGANARLEATGTILVQNNPDAPADARLWLGGFVRSSATDDVTLGSAVLLTSDDARVATRGGGGVIFLGAIDSAAGAGSPFNLRVFTDVGEVKFNSAIGAATPAGDVVVESAFDVTVSSTLAASSFTVGKALGAVEFDGAVTTTGFGANLSVNAASLLVKAPITATAPGALSSTIFFQTENIAITADISGDGTITVQPQTDGRSIGINAAGDLNLTTAEIVLLQSGAASIQIGRSSGTGAMTIGSITFNHSVLLLSPAGAGSITVNGTLAGTGTASIELDAAAINLNVASPAAAISTAGKGVALIGNVHLLANTLINTNFAGAGGDVNTDGTINGAFALRIDAGDFLTGGTVEFGGAANAPGGASIGGGTALASLLVEAGTITLGPRIVTSGAQTYSANNAIEAFVGSLRSKVSGAITLDGPLQLNGGLPIFTSGLVGADIVFTSTVDGVAIGGALALNSGANGAVHFQGNVGTTTALSKIIVANSGSILADGELRATTSISLDSNEIDFAGGADSVGTTNGTLTLQTHGITTAVLVGGTADPGASTLHLSTTDLAALDGNSHLIRIARVTGTGGLTIAAAGATFRSPVEFHQSGRIGAISVLGNVTGTGNASLGFTVGTTTLAANLRTAGQPIRVDHPFLGTNLVTVSTIESGAPGADVTFAGALLTTGAGAHNLTVTAGTGTVNFLGSVGNTASKPGALDVTAALIKVNSSLTAGSLTFTGNTELRGNLIATSTTAGQIYTGDVKIGTSLKIAVPIGPLQITGTINSPAAAALTIVTTENITVGGEVGGVTRLGVIAVTTTGSATFAAPITGQSLLVKAASFAVNDVSTNTSQTYSGIGTFNGALTANTLKITAKNNIAIAAPVVVTSTATFLAKGFDVSATNSANQFGRLDATARHATFAETGDTSLGTVNLTGTLTLDSTGNVAQVGRLTVNAIDITSGGAVQLGSSVNTIHSIQKIAAQTGVLLVATHSNLALDGPTSTVTGDIVVATSAFFSTTAYNVFNHVGSSAFSHGSSGRLLVYSYAQSASRLTGVTFDHVSLGLRYPLLPPGYSDDLLIYFRA